MSNILVKLLLFICTTELNNVSSVLPVFSPKHLPTPGVWSRWHIGTVSVHTITISAIAQYVVYPKTNLKRRNQVLKKYQLRKWLDFASLWLAKTLIWSKLFMTKAFLVSYLVSLESIIQICNVAKYLGSSGGGGGWPHGHSPPLHSFRRGWGELGRGRSETTLFTDKPVGEATYFSHISTRK